MNKKEQMENFLENQPLARERSNKNRAIANLLLKGHPSLEIGKSLLTEIVGEALSIDRLWRKVLEEREDLRGSDYKQGKILSQEKQIELGYEPAHHRNIKALNRL